MIPDAYRPLFERLHEKTLAGEVNWGRSARTDHFVVSFSDFSLRIFNDLDQESGREFVGIRLINDQGRDADGFWVEEGEPDFDQAIELYQGAKRRAYRIDVTLNRIMQELDRAGEVGEPSPEEEPPDDGLPF